jgi:hypothetical protein
MNEENTISEFKKEKYQLEIEVSRLVRDFMTKYECGLIDISHSGFYDEKFGISLFIEFKFTL